MWQQEADFVIMEGDVHVWRASLQVNDAAFLACQKSLSPEEKARANRFYSEQHGRRFSVGRGALRSLLSRYTGVPAAEVEFEYTANGKPSVRHPKTPIRFNLSHSGDLCVIAFSATTELGVDIEESERRLEALEISERFFTPEEHAAIQNGEDSKRVETFLRFWTAKEAVMKGAGLGLLLEPNAIAVALDPLRIVSLRVDVQCTWNLHAFDPAPGYIGTLAVDPAIKRFKFFEWPTTAEWMRPD